MYVRLLIKPLVTESMVKIKGKVGKAREAELVHKGGEGGTSHSIKTNSVKIWPKTLGIHKWHFWWNEIIDTTFTIPIIQLLETNSKRFSFPILKNEAFF